MSSLSDILEKLARADAEATEVDDVSDDLYTTIDPVYVEKLASAVDWIVSGIGTGAPTQETEKQANAAAVKANMAKGMPAEEAVKTAYPNWSQDQVDALVAKMGGSPTKEASAVPTEALRNKLQEKIAARAAAVQDNSEMVSSILSRLQSLTDEEEDTDGQELSVVEDTDSVDSQETSEATGDFASILRSVLDHNETTTDDIESASPDSAETEEVSGDDESLQTEDDSKETLKFKLLSRVGTGS